MPDTLSRLQLCQNGVDCGSWTHRRAARPEEHHARVLERSALGAHAVEEASQNHTPGALDVVVEAQALLPVALQHRKGARGLEVLVPEIRLIELNSEIRKKVPH